MKSHGIWLSLVLLGLLSYHAQAATKTWDGGGTDNNWQTGANWDADSPPAPNDSLVFAGTTRLSNNNDFAANTQFNGITFNNTAGAFTLNGNAINLGGNVTDNDTDTQTIGLNLAMTATRDFSVVSGGTLSIGGIISGAGFGITKSGTGTLTLNGANTYTGNTTLNGTLPSTLNIGNATALGTGTLIMGTSGTLDNTSGSALAIANAFTMSGGSPTFTGSSALTIDGAVTISAGDRTITVNASTLTLNGAISETGSRSLTKAGAGTLVLNNTSSHTGGTILSAGTLVFGNNSAPGTGTLSLNGGTVQATGGPGTIGNALSIGGNSAFSGSENLTFTGSGSFGNSDRSFTVDNTTTFSGNISANGNRNFTKSGTGTLILSGDNSWGGTTTINGGVVNMQHANALGGTGNGTTVNSGAALQIQGGISTSEALTLNGLGVSSAGALRNISGANQFGGAVTLGSASRINSDAGTLTLNGGITGGGNALTIGGVGNVAISTAGISGSGTSLTKDGAGTLTFNVASTYTGGTTLTAGTLQLGASDVLPNTGTFTFAGGTLAMNSQSDIDAGALSLQSSTISIVAFGNDTLARNLFFDSGSLSGGQLLIQNWDGTVFTAGQDTFRVAGLTQGTFISSSFIQFYDDLGSPIGDGGYVLNSSGDVVPAPEPINVALAIFGCGMLGVHACRRLRRPVRSAVCPKPQ